MTLQPSRYIAAVLIGTHASAAFTLVPLDVPRWVQLALALGIGMSLARALWRHALLRSRRAFLAVELASDGRAAALTRDGEWHDALLLDSTYVSPLLTVLNLQITGRTFPCHVLLVPDNCEPDAFRRLRVWLRWGTGALSRRRTSGRRKNA